MVLFCISILLEKLKIALDIVKKRGGMYRRKLFLLTVIIFLPIVFISSLNLKSVCALASDILEHGKNLYSKNNEELIIRDFFNERKNGFFVDLGCSWYEAGNNTYYLEKHLGWSGIAIDALNEYALDYIEHRPNTKFFNFIVTDHSGTVESFYRQPECLGDSSIYEEQIIKHADEKKLVKIIELSMLRPLP